MCSILLVAVALKCPFPLKNDPSSVPFVLCRPVKFNWGCNTSKFNNNPTGDAVKFFS